MSSSFTVVASAARHFSARRDLSGCDLNGTLPLALFSLKNLTALILANNKVSGTISGEIGKLESIKSLDLSSNIFYGVLPASFKSLSSSLEMLYGFFRAYTLPSLDLSKNQLTGGIPQELLTLHSGNFRFTDNFFTAGDCLWNVENNCLAEEACPNQKQRAPRVCAQFCNAPSSEGACDGHGSCRLDPDFDIPTCICNANFTNDPFNSAACVPGVSRAGLDRDAENYTLGIAEAPAASQLKFLNRWSRYLSVGAYTQQQVPGWRVGLTSSWMAPGHIYLGFDRTITSAGTGTMRWNFVRDQAQCASCWAITAVDSVAAAAAIATLPLGGDIPFLSSDQVLLCTNTSNSGSSACREGFPTHALEYSVAAPIVENVFYRNNRICGSETLLVPQVVMHEAVKFRGWLGLLLTVQIQPAVVVLEGSAKMFQNPACQLKGFVLKDPTCYSGSLDHSVLVVGYDLTSLNPYWVIRNSWGYFWCQGGYLRVGVQGGDGICGMNVIPAVYPIPAPSPGDPCYSRSTKPDGTTSASMDPCGSGTCTPRPEWGSFSYNCTCPPNFVAVNNTVPITLPGAGLGITQTCTPIDACGLPLDSPCTLGTCVNDGEGGSSCICPLGYFPNTAPDGKTFCSLGDEGPVFFHPSLECCIVED